MERHPVGILPPPNPPRDSPPDCRKRCGFDHRLGRPVLYPLSYGRLNRDCATNLNCLPICRSIHGASSGRHPASPESAVRQSTGLSQALRIRPPAWKAGAQSVELRAPARMIPATVQPTHPIAPPRGGPRGGGLVGVEGFEPPTSCSQSRRATRLRYTPHSTAARGSRIASGCPETDGLISRRRRVPQHPSPGKWRARRDSNSRPPSS